VVRALKLEEGPDENSSIIIMEEIVSLNKEIKETGEKFLKADDNLDKSFWLGEVQRLTKRLKNEEQLLKKQMKNDEQKGLKNDEQLRKKAEKEWLTGCFSLFTYDF